MEAELSNSEWLTPFIAGPQFTIADATFMPYFALFGPAGLALELESRPALKKWVGQCLSRPSWQYTKDMKVMELNGN